MSSDHSHGGLSGSLSRQSGEGEGIQINVCPVRVLRSREPRLIGALGDELAHAGYWVTSLIASSASARSQASWASAGRMTGIRSPDVPKLLRRIDHDPSTGVAPFVGRAPQSPRPQAAGRRRGSRCGSSCGFALTGERGEQDEAALRRVR